MFNRETVKKEIAAQIIGAKELVTKALEFKGLQFAQMGSVSCSKPFATQLITKAFFKAMVEQNCVIRICGATTGGHLRIYLGKPTARDEAYIPTTQWAFPRDNSVSLELSVGFKMSFGGRCLRLFPRVFSNQATAMEDVQMAIFRAYAMAFPESDPIVKEIILGEGSAYVGFWNLGLGGLRSIASLFSEFCGDNSGNLSRLAHSDLNPFSFDPTGSYMPIGERERYLPEPYQPQLLRLWAAEREEYKSRI
jgi:hypothetical protein